MVMEAIQRLIDNVSQLFVNPSRGCGGGSMNSQGLFPTVGRPWIGRSLQSCPFKKDATAKPFARPSRPQRDRGGNTLAKATSLSRYLQGLSTPGSQRFLKDTIGKEDTAIYKLFNGSSAAQGNFQTEGLILSLNFQNLAQKKITVAFLDQQGRRLGNRTVNPSETLVRSLSKNVYYIRVKSQANGEHQYEMSLPIINS
jgi:hypothetical protein